MRHYSYSINRQIIGDERGAVSQVSPGEIRRERVPTFVDELDCLLAVWMAEATLDGEDEPAKPEP
jgi:hypothetical protein